MPVSHGKAISVTGIVQGVGFRPFVYSLATRYSLVGDVLNSPQGVRIRVFGNRPAIDSFITTIRESSPPLARVDTVSVTDIEAEPPERFSIFASSAAGGRSVAVAPDAAICADCRREVLDPTDRRHRYPFINCTNCGPRYSIIQDVPYDRPNTTMRSFVMCATCQAEYDDPADRRFHAQPNCCSVCGPSLSLFNADGNITDGDPVAETARLLDEGKIVAIKGLGGFHLACDATSEVAVTRLRERKHREEKPFAIMAGSIANLEEVVKLSVKSRSLLSSSAAPVVIARKKHPSCIAAAVSPVNDYHGTILAYTPLHLLLFAEGIRYLVMTSANLTDEPIVIANDEALERLNGVADYFLTHDRDIGIRVDDSVVTAEPLTIIRRARGYTPSGIETGVNVDGIAGFGPFMKNTLAIGRGTEIFPGQHVGDLENRMALEMFHEIYHHLRDIMGIETRVAACDLHPDYPTTRLAEETGLPVVRVQHHHAHLAALMAEKQEYSRSIGVAFDGTGYGTDGEIWGGEFFIFDPASCQRRYHLEYVSLPGGDKAAREPWRMALSYLIGNNIDWHKYVDHPTASQVADLLGSDITRFQTSSAGRLFDAVSSLCGFCQMSTYDAKAPMALEGAAEMTDDWYDFRFADSSIVTGDIIRGVVCSLDEGEKTSRIAGRFHRTVAQIILTGAQKLRQEEDLNTVFLSGGVMMNALLVKTAANLLEETGFTVHTHTLLPPNDGGVSAGQIMVAAALGKDGTTAPVL